MQDSIHGIAPWLARAVSTLLPRRRGSPVYVTPTARVQWLLWRTAGVTAGYGGADRRCLSARSVHV